MFVAGTSYAGSSPYTKSRAVKQMKMTSRRLEELQTWVGKKNINLDEAMINRDLLEMHGPPDEVSQNYHGLVIENAYP